MQKCEAAIIAAAKEEMLAAEAVQLAAAANAPNIGETVRALWSRFTIARHLL
jgi:hypothetical protein